MFIPSPEERQPVSEKQRRVDSKRAPERAAESRSSFVPAIVSSKREALKRITGRYPRTRDSGN